MDLDAFRELIAPYRDGTPASRRLIRRRPACVPTGGEDAASSAAETAALHVGEGVVIDPGTGDGLFVYQSAKENPAKYFIGIDANPRALEKISEKVHRKPVLPNILFVQAAVEDLPPELSGVADEVHVHFPWGSLLRAVATGERAVLENIRRICAPGALVEVIIGINPERDRAEFERLGLQSPFIDAANYEAAGFEVIESGTLPASEWAKLRTSWAKRLQRGAGRILIYLVVRAA